ncbi:unnamed protein product [Strongylus vulgaris]|uniref:Uncharacterized protein n=1 Tax=Strongylus vulgaris TaxID=40348 RepID=A0A3P7JLX9_STRVU|nr:unnamed protein product [Strongylus vulgaris]
MSREIPVLNYGGSATTVSMGSNPTRDTSGNAYPNPYNQGSQIGSAGERYPNPNQGSGIGSAGMTYPNQGYGKGPYEHARK